MTSPGDLLFNRYDQYILFIRKFQYTEWLKNILVNLVLDKTIWLKIKKNACKFIVF